MRGGAMAEGDGERLARLLQEARLTQTKLAQHLGVTRSLVSRFVTNRQEMKAGQIRAIVRFVQSFLPRRITSDELLGLREENEESTIAERETKPRCAPESRPRLSQHPLLSGEYSPL